MTDLFRQACLRPIPAARIAKMLNCSVDKVLEVKRDYERERVRAYKARLRDAEAKARAARAEMLGVQQPDRTESLRDMRDRLAMATWCRMQIWFEDSLASRRGADGSRYVRDLLKLPF